MAHETRFKGRGGIKHLYWQHRICEAFRSKGYYAEIEVALGDTFLDVFASDEAGRRIGVQVVTGDLDSHEFVGIRKAVEAGLDEVVVACESESVKGAINRSLGDELEDIDTDNVVVVLLSEWAQDLNTSESHYYVGETVADSEDGREGKDTVAWRD